MTDQRRPGKKRKIVWCVVLIVFLAGMSWFAYFRWSVSHRLTQQIALLESQGYPVTLGQLNDWYQLPAGADNGADYYMEAFAWRVQWDNEVAKPLPFVGSASLPEPNSPLDPNTLALMQDYLKDNAEAIQWLNKGAQCPNARYPMDYQEGAMAPMPWLADIRQCAKLYSLQMLLAIEQGRPDEFVMVFSNGMALADSLKPMPTLISQLVRIGCIGMFTGDLMERGLGRLEFSDEQLIQLSKRLETAKDVDWLIRTHAGEACMMIDMMRNPTSMLMNDNSGLSGWTSLLLIPYRVLGLRDRDLCAYLALTQVTLNPEVSTFQGLLEAGRLAETRRAAIPRSYLMLHLLSPAMGRITELYARYYGGQISAQTALAVQRFHLKYQRLPENLAVLVPEFMAAVPVDPKDGKPIRYIKQAKGFVVYSVGEDGQDNGGRERDPKERSKPYDRVFSVQNQD